MTIENKKPKDCPALLAKGWTYLDVRTPEEFEQGHPDGAFNVPVMLRGPAGMSPNPQFGSVVTKHFAKDAGLVVGCASGVRSQRACQELAALGYTQLVNMECGFGGARDASGRVTMPGWEGSGLPVASGAPAHRSWTALRGAK